MTNAFTNFRIFRSSSDRKLFAIHAVDKDENSLQIIKDNLQFDVASDMMQVLHPEV